MKIDDYRQMLYRLDQLKDPDPRIRAEILKEIDKCDRSNANPSTNFEARKSSATRQGELKL